MKKIIIFFLTFCLLSNVYSSTLTVGAGQTYATISSAITAANDGDTILINTNIQTEANISIAKSVTISGLGMTNTILQPYTSRGGGGSAATLFSANTSGKQFSLKNMTIRYCTNSASSGVVLTLANSANICVTGLISNCQITQNDGISLYWGIIHIGNGSNSVLYVDKSIFSSNNGVSLQLQGNSGSSINGGLIVSNSSFIYNTVPRPGSTGNGTVTKSASSLSMFQIINSTFYGNTSSGQGAAISVLAISLTVADSNNYIYNCTICSNACFSNNYESGVYYYGSNIGLDKLRIESCIISSNANISFGNHYGIMYITNSLVFPTNNINTGINYTNGNLFGIDPLLTTLSGNGGVTPTIPLSIVSPCISKGSNPLNLSFDQRGSNYIRQDYLSGLFDMGAIQQGITRTVGLGATGILANVLNYSSVSNAHAASSDLDDIIIVTNVQTESGIVITKSVNLSGLGMTNTILQGDFSRSNTNIGRVVKLFNANKAMTVQNMTIQYGSYSNGADNYGGAGIYFEAGTCSVVNCNVCFNDAYSAAYGGGGICYSDSTYTPLVIISNCFINSNTSTGPGGNGGGIGGKLAANLIVYGSTLASNSCSIQGGGINVSGYLNGFTMANSTICYNSSGTGGGAITYTGQTNFVGYIYNSTIFSNGCTNTIGYGLQLNGGPIFLNSTIVASNFNSSASAEFVGGVRMTASNCLFQGTTSGAFTNSACITGISPQLGTFGYYGGNVPVFPSTALSPCIDTGINPLNLTYDQTGLPRTFGSATDIGAYELGTIPTLTVGLGATGTLVTAPNYPTISSAIVAAYPASTVIQIVTNVQTESNITLNKSLTIQGNGPNNTIIQAANVRSNYSAGSVLFIPFNGGKTCTIQNITIKNGFTNGSGAAIYSSVLSSNNIINLLNVNFVNNDSALNSGGACYFSSGGGNGALINVSNCNFIANSATNSGGAIYQVSGTMNMYNCNIISNQGVSATGGGIYIGGASTTVNVQNCILSYNKSGTSGGAIYNTNYGSNNYLNNTMSFNIAGGAGGGQCLTGAATNYIKGCSYIYNTSSSGGAIYNSAVLLLINSTIYSNYSSGNGGAVYLYITSSNYISNCSMVSNVCSGSSGGAGLNYGVAIINSTLFSQNTSSGGAGRNTIFSQTGTSTLNNCYYDGSLVVAGGGTNYTSLCITGSTTSFIVSPLASNGGITPTCQLLGYSNICWYAGTNSLYLLTDQRGTGYSRTANGGIDIGALQYHSYPTNIFRDVGITGSDPYYNTISNAYLGSVKNDTILILTNLITETGLILTNNITIMGQTGQTSTIWQACNVRSNGALSASNFISRMIIVSNAILNLQNITMQYGWITNGSGNRASSYGGAAIWVRYGTALVNNVTFQFNDAILINGGGSGGGAIAQETIIDGNLGSTRLDCTNCLFLGNTVYGGGGGGIYSGNPLNLYNCTFWSNATINNTYGGGLYTYTGGTGLTQNMVNCTFYQNSSYYGAGSYASWNIVSIASVINCSMISNNGAYGSGGSGGGSGSVILNCLIDGGEPLRSGGAVITVSNLLYTGSISSGGVGSFNNMFQYPAGSITYLPWGKYNGVWCMPLSPTSPGIDMGVPVSFATDQIGNPRTVGSNPDCGAIESPQSVINIGTTNNVWNISGTSNSIVMNANNGTTNVLLINEYPDIVLSNNLNIFGNGNAKYGLNLSGNISGTGGVIVSSGDITLSGSNSYSGVTMITNGTVNIGNNFALGTNQVTFNNAIIGIYPIGSTIYCSNNPAWLIGSGASLTGFGTLHTGTNSTTINGNITLVWLNATLSIDGSLVGINNNTTLTKGTIGNNSTLIVNGPMSLTNLYIRSGNTILNGDCTSSGQLQVGSGNNSVIFGSAFSCPAFLNWASGTLDTSLDTILTNNPNLTIIGTFIFSGSHFLNIGTGKVVSTVGMTITTNNLEFDGPFSTSSGFTKTGNGGLILGGQISNSNNPIAINGGTLWINGNNIYLSNMVNYITVAGGGKLAGTGVNICSNRINSGGILYGGGTNTYGILTQSNDVIFAANSTNIIYIQSTSAYSQINQVSGVFNLTNANIKIIDTGSTGITGNIFTNLYVSGLGKYVGSYSNALSGSTVTGLVFKYTINLNSGSSTNITLTQQ